MQHAYRWLILVVILAVLPLLACNNDSVVHDAEHPAEVEHIEGTEFSRVTFSERAMERIGVQTDTVREVRMSPPRFAVPYSAILYTSHGETWVYTCPAPRTFVRRQVEVDYIEGDTAFLTKGPEAGTVVASVGVAEIYGTEFEVGH